MKNKLFYGIIILFLCSIFTSCATLSVNKDSGKITYSFKTVEISENQDYLTTNIKYPEFEKLPELNKRIANTVNSNWKNFKSYSKSEWDEIVALNNRGSTKLPVFEYLVTYEVTGNKNIYTGKTVHKRFHAETGTAAGRYNKVSVFTQSFKNTDRKI